MTGARKRWAALRPMFEAERVALGRRTIADFDVDEFKRVLRRYARETGDVDGLHEVYFDGLEREGLVRLEA